MSILKLWKKNIWQIGIVLIMLFAMYLHFSNLNDALILDSDEARAFRYLSSGPLITLMCSPFLPLKSFDFPFYMSAFLGFMNILIFWLILKDLFESRTIFFIIAAYAFFPFRINYARMLMQPVYTEFFFLLSMLFVIKGLNKKRPNLMVAAGICGALGFFAHAHTYMMIFGIFTAFSVACLIEKEKKLIIPFLARYLAGFIVSCIALQAVLYFTADKYNYFQNVFEKNQGMSLNGYLNEDYVKERFVWFFRTLFNKMTNSPTVLVRSVFVVSALISSCLVAFKKRQKWLLFFIITGFSGASLFFTATLIKIHPLNYRHFIWLAPMLSLCVGYITASAFNGFRRTFLSKVIFLGFVFFVTTSVLISRDITDETFKKTEIREWFIEHNVPFDKIIRTNITVNKFGDKAFAKYIPGAYAGIDDMDVSYKIAWPLVYNAYLSGKTRYMLTSGIGRHMYIGLNELLLKYVRPEKVFDSPFVKFKYRFFEIGNVYGPLKIEIYDLEKVFSTENFILIAREDPGFVKRFQNAIEKGEQFVPY